MPADIGAKPVGPSRFEDLVRLLGLDCPHLPEHASPPNPKVAALKTGAAKFLLALILLNQVSQVECHRMETLIEASGISIVRLGAALGFGGFLGWALARTIHRTLTEWLWPRFPCRSGSRSSPGRCRSGFQCSLGVRCHSGFPVFPSCGPGVRCHSGFPCRTMQGQASSPPPRLLKQVRCQVPFRFPSSPGVMCHSGCSCKPRCQVPLRFFMQSRRQVPLRFPKQPRCQGKFPSPGAAQVSSAAQVPGVAQVSDADQASSTTLFPVQPRCQVSFSFPCS